MNIQTFILAIFLFINNAGFSQGFVNFQDTSNLNAHRAPLKPIFISFYADWCAPCKKMDQNCFTDPQVVEMLNENFINYRIDGESTVGKSLMQKYDVNAFPTGIFLDKEMNVISRYFGYTDVAALMDMVEVSIGLDREGLKKMRDISDDPESLLAQIKSLDKLHVNSDPHVNRLFELLTDQQLRESKYLELLYHKVDRLNVDNKGYRYFIDHIDVLKDGPVSLSGADSYQPDNQYRGQLLRKLRKPLNKLRQEAEENKNVSSYLEYKRIRTLVHNGFFETNSFVQQRNSYIEDVNFYAKLEDTLITQNTVLLLTNLLLSEYSVDEMIAKNNEIYTTAKQSILNTKPDYHFKQEDEAILNSFMYDYRRDLQFCLKYLSKTEADKIEQTEIYVNGISEYEKTLN